MVRMHYFFSINHTCRIIVLNYIRYSSLDKNSYFMHVVQDRTKFSTHFIYFTNSALSSAKHVPEYSCFDIKEILVLIQCMRLLMQRLYQSLCEPRIGKTTKAAVKGASRMHARVASE